MGFWDFDASYASMMLDEIEEEQDGRLLNYHNVSRCKRCGQRTVRLINKDNMHYCLCNTCGSQGNIKHDKVKSIKSWNKKNRVGEIKKIDIPSQVCTEDNDEYITVKKSELREIIRNMLKNGMSGNE